MARISTYPNDTYVTGRDKWIGSDADNNYITKNFTSNAVAAYFNRSAIIDTGQFAWSFIPYSDTQPQPEKTFMKIDWVDDTININNLAGVLRVSALTIANTTPGDFMVNEWIGKNILVHFPGAPSAYSIYTVDSLVLDPDSSWFYLMTLTFVSGESFVVQENDSVVMGYFSEVGVITTVTATTPLFSSGGSTPNITIQVANTSQSGYLTNTDWNTFNAKQGALTLTTTGSSGAATLIGNTLNIPNYTNALTGYVPYIGATADVDLATHSLTASSIIKAGGTSSEFLMADGSTSTLSISSVIDFGADPTGVNDSYSAIVDAIAYATTSNSILYFPEGTYKTSNTLDFRNLFVNATQATITGNHSNIVLIIGGKSTLANNPEQNIGVVKRTTGVSSTPTMRVLGAKGQTISVQYCDYMQLYADSNNTTTTSIAYSTFNLVYVAKLEFSTNPSPTGSTVQWINENTFNLNRVTTFIMSGTYSHNNNYFVGGTFENASITLNTGNSNTFTNVRFEATNSVTFASGTINNSIFQTWFDSLFTLATETVNATVVDNGIGNTCILADSTNRLTHIVGSASANDVVLNTQYYFNERYPSLGCVRAKTNTLTQYLIFTDYIAVNKNDIFGFFKNDQANLTSKYRSQVFFYDQYKNPVTPVLNTNYASSSYTTIVSNYVTQGVGLDYAMGVLLNNDVSFIKIKVLASSSNFTSATAFDVQAYIRSSNNDFIAARTNAKPYSSGLITSPLTVSNIPTQGYAPLGFQANKSDNSENYVSVLSIDTNLTNPVTAASTIIDVNNATGVVIGDIVGILNNDIYTTNWTTVANVSGTTITLSSPLTGNCNANNRVVFMRWASNTSVKGSGTTNYVPKFTSTSVLGDSNIQDNGSLITLGANTNVSSGGLGIGTSSLTQYGLRVGKNITGAVTSYGVLSGGTVQSDVTSNAQYFTTSASTVASSFTLPTLAHYRAGQGTLGSGSTVTNQYGFWADTTITGGTNNYGFIGSIASGTNRWNIYMGGTANNYLAGSLGIGSTSLASTALRVGKTITGSTNASGVLTDGVIQSDVTAASYGFRYSASTEAASFTLTDLVHYSATQSTIGAGSTVTNQYGFRVDSAVIGATNNYGFYGNIPSASGRWNLYMNGTASNYLNGTTLVGKNTDSGLAKLQILGAIQQSTVLSSLLKTNSDGVLIAAIAGTDYVSPSTLSSYVPYTGATADVNLGLFDLYTAKVWLYDNPNSGYGSMELTDGVLHFEDVDGHSMVTMEDGYLTIANSSTIRALLNVTGLTVNRDYAFPNASGTLALTSDLPINPITGSGTVNYVPKFDTTSSIANSNIQDSGTLITLGSNTNVSSGSLGIGGTSLTNVNLRIDKSITGGTTSYGIHQASTIQSDVTATAIYNSVSANTVASAFTLGALIYFNASQSTFGSGSAVTLQVGYNVAANLIGGVTNYGYRGLIPSGTNRWNIYMDGTANNYLAGSLGIGSASLLSSGLTDVSLRVSKNLTGATTNVVGVKQDGTVQSDATGIVSGHQNELITAAASFTVANYFHFRAFQNVIGAGSAVTTQAGFVASGNIVSATNNYGFWGAIPSGGNRYNLYMSGTADNYFAGSLGIGSTTLTGFSLRVSKSLSGSTTPIGVLSDGTAPTTATGNINYFRTIATTDASLTSGALNHYSTNQGTFGAGTTITNQHGFIVDSTLIGATNNYGFRGLIASGTNRWNIYMDGTADNYLAGSLGIGSTTLTGYALRIAKTITGAVTSFGISTTGAIQSDVTTQAIYNNITSSTAAASFTLTTLSYYNASQGTFGAGSAVTTQIGYSVASNFIGATTNYGYRGLIPAQTGAWNLYMDGTAQNYLAGALSIGVTTANASALFQVDSTTKGALFPRMTTTQKNAITSPATGLVVFDTTLGKLCVFSTTWQTITSV